ncbi:GntR family transcriptional regulator [Acuticoccus sp. I52.16.1]|uniref:GntR family transcriptional regulator n=1 Tax=Acuticoccus sp. I52.16.1 TaxID=2928472 RepID=UPI001FD50EC5|nr:GntR family transcriptional regulator [Acuticoccus sp. I52.16.1]UOM32966.1 GntR family transcriptional regulator [Acuticoccus sp. I52.16.1]
METTVAPTETPAKPRYQTISATLKDEILAGRCPLGSNLPTEHALSERFGASRHTVREALRQLQTDGLIERRQGAGSRVIATAPAAHFSNTISSLAELMQYASSTFLEVLTKERILIGAAEAARVGCKADTLWARVALLRRESIDAPPVCYTLCYLPTRFEGVVDTIGTVPTAVYRIVEDRYATTLHQVHQIVEATLADADVASRLGVAPGSPILTVTRRYETERDGLMEVTVNHHPAATFRHEMTLTNVSRKADEPAQTEPLGEART